MPVEIVKILRGFLMRKDRFSHVLVKIVEQK